METKQAVQALSALAQDTRLGIFRLLVQAGPAGMAAGQIGEKLDLAPATLSFHLAGLTRAGLAASRQDGRFVIYSADFQAMNALVGFLSENCCGGQSCAPSTGESNEAPTRTRRSA
jgi:ArsR family transcriptional regulator, arsenate/arsenite/antimonite-responsive transcriptional repressor